MSATTRTIHAHARRDGRWWYIDIPELGTSGQARTLKDVDSVAREIAALWLDADETTVHVTVAVELPTDAAELWGQADAADMRARQDAQAAARLRRSAVASLKAQGISQADAARVLGVSQQRVSQLAHA